MSSYQIYLLKFDDAKIMIIFELCNSLVEKIQKKSDIS